MSDLYDYYLEQGGPALPDGYSFKIERNENRPQEMGFSIIGPPEGWRKKRYKQRFTDDYLGPYNYGKTRWYTVDSETNRKGTKAPIEYMNKVIRELYAEWRAYSYETEISDRWFAFVGEHP